jgi:hypothetical protein
MAKRNQIQANPTTMVVPSSWALTQMIARAEAKFAADRERCLRDRAYEAQAINARKTREEREHNARRYLNAGVRP